VNGEAPGGVAHGFEPVARAFERLVGRGAGGGALHVRLREEPVVDLVTGTADRRGRRPWTPDTLSVSFSTTKGIASTIVHVLADRGLLGYDDPVAKHWPAFAQGGKEHVTVRDLLTHRAGLSSARAVASRAEDLLDFMLMEERLATRSVRAPTRLSAYHAITYGWLVAGLVRGVTGRGMKELVDSELGIDGLHIGAPAQARERVALPVGSALRQAGAAAQTFAPVWTRARRAKPVVDALLVPGFHRLFEGDEPPIWTTEMPAVNGTFSARALAELYGELANAGGRILSPSRAHQMSRVQVRTPDAVLGLKMRWRLGYHQALGTGSAEAFGHYGYGGSGAWADPSLGLSCGFVTNRIGSISTPLGDLTLMRLNRVVYDCARRRVQPRAA
jgi:CubicO group peptidase (beta-lactamase class C family)